MRKGRSQRKQRAPRGSLTPASAVSTAGGPQVFIGVSRPTNDAAEGPSDAFAPDAAPTGDIALPESAPSEAIQTRSAPLQGVLEVVPEADDVDREARGSLSPSVEAASLIEQAVRAAIDAEATPIPAPVATISEPPVTSASPTSLDAVVTELRRTPPSDPPPEPAAAQSADPVSPDEISIPPIGDLTEHEGFFSEGDLARHVGDDSALEERIDAKTRRKLAPDVQERRARFAVYVRWAVGGAAIVCLAALGRSAVMPPSAAVDARPAAAAPLATGARLDTRAAAVGEPSPEPVKPAAAPPEPAAPEQDPTAAKTDPTAAAAAAEARPAAVDPASAAIQKTASRRALEAGKTDEAILAGEKSVALDPEDGEAWLILGAAYQEKGKLGDARRCYTACVKDAKRGPRDECSAMLR